MSATPESNRLVQIDALRGIAALWVVLFHYTVRYEELFGHTSSPGFYLIDGRMGVHLFFMISGFVILMSLDRVKQVKDFVFFRFARLYPTFWACAAVTFVVTKLASLPGRTVGIKDALFNIPMLSITIGKKPIDAVYWSLEVELFFYALMAVIVFLRLRPRLVAIITALVVVNGILLAIPGPVIDLPRVVKGIRLLLSLRYLHFFLFGILCYELQQWRAHTSLPFKEYPHRSLFIVATLVSVVASCLETPSDECVYTMILGVLFYAATQYRISFLHNKSLLFLGACSYPLYTIHQNIGFVVIRFFESHGIPGFIAVVGTAALLIMLAHMISRTVENPTNQMLRAWYKKTLTAKLANSEISKG